MTTPLRILLIEDSHKDAQLMLAQLRQNGYELTSDRVQTAEDLQTALESQKWDLILCDYQMPRFTGLEALRILKETNLDIPFIIVSGAIGEETAVQAMKEGAHDYILKSNLARLFPAIERELKDAKIRAQKRKAEEEIRILNGELEQRVIERTSELTEALTQLQESEKFRNQFVSALTHDLRTPLIAQERALEILANQKETLSPKLATLSERLLKSNQDLLKMVNMLLEGYQYEAAKVQLFLDELNLYQLVSDCLAELGELAKSKQISLSNLIPSDLPVIMADRDQIKRVFINLIGNALQNIPAGSEVVAHGVMERNVVQLQVRDNGQGIPEEILPHLFKRYFVGDHSRKKIGTGLGLSICKMILELHQGSIRVESLTGQGTTFFITLPIQQNSGDNLLEQEVILGCTG